MIISFLFGQGSEAVSVDAWFIMVGGDNVVYTDLNSKMITAEKHVCSNFFVVTDINYNY